MSEWTLKVDGVVYGGWKSLRVSRSMEQVADSFDFSTSDRWKEGAVARPIRPGAPCTVAYAGQTVVKGYVDEVSMDYSATQHSIRVSGRSLAGELVDTTWLPANGNASQWSGQTLMQVAVTLAGTYGVAVATDLNDVELGGPFKNVAMNPGESVWSFLEKLAGHRGVRFVSQSDGSLLITRAGLVDSGGAIELGVNTLSAQGRLSHRERFRLTRVRGQAATEERWDPQLVSEADAYDGEIRTTRHRLIIASGQVSKTECLARALWQTAVSRGRAQSVTYTVQGWHNPTGLWQINTRVPVRDSYQGIDDKRLIVTTDFVLDESGSRTEITLMPIEAFQMILEPEPVDTEKKWS